jgi:hypothetical protein
MVTFSTIVISNVVIEIKGGLLFITLLVAKNSLENVTILVGFVTLVDLTRSVGHFHWDGGDFHSSAEDVSFDREGDESNPTS